MAVVDAPAQAMLAEIVEAERFEYALGAFDAFERGSSADADAYAKGGELEMEWNEAAELSSGEAEAVFVLYDLASSLGLVLGPFFVAAVVCLPSGFLPSPLDEQVYRFELSVLPLALACLCWAPLMRCAKVRGTGGGGGQCGGGRC